MVRHKVTRLRVLWLALLLAFALCPVRAYADTTPTEFFEDLAGAVGVTIDLASEVWQDKTVSAYEGYISERLRNTTTPLDFYGYGSAIQDLTGYDVVAFQDGRYYMKSCPDASGGAMYDIDCGDVSNMAALLQETMKWIRYSSENGPQWPNGSSGSGSGGGGIEGDIPNTITVVGIVGNYHTYAQNWLDITGVTFNISVGNVQSLNSSFQSLGLRYWVCLGTQPSIRGSQPNCTIYASESPIQFEQYQSNGGNYGWTRSSATTLYRAAVGQASFTVDNGGLQEGIGLVSNAGGGFGGGGGGGAIPDDDPPKEPDPEHDPITWPDITIGNLPSFSPTINITNNSTYNQATGEIDLTPITERLDAINANLELFYQSFNEYRSDFLHYMGLIGDALETIETDIWNCETQLRLAVKWLQNIFYKQGGTGSSKPDIGTNNNGFWDWLREVLTNLLGQLPQSLSEMLDIFEDLSGYFPFCVPWDLYALLAMFAADPQTPIFDLPMPVPDVVNHAKYLNIHLDFSGYNIVAQQVRKIELIMFSAWLTLTTPKLLQGITNVGKVKG